MKKAVFAIPEDATAYIGQIRTRVRNLIDCQIWTGIDQNQIDTWLSNFISPEDQYFASRILDSLIFRSAKQTDALIDQVFYKCIPDSCNLLSSDYLEQLRGKDDPKIRIVPVIRDDDPPTKSGPLVARLIKRRLKINEKWMIWPFHINDMADNGVKTFIFVDDFLGTGDQFKKFANRNELDEFFHDHECIYSPLAASHEGVQELNNTYSDLIVTSAEFLEESSNIFSDESDCFRDGLNTPDIAKDYYDKLLERVSGIKIAKNKRPYGYGHLGMTYIFHHAAPNASIPLLWYEYDNFTPLFNR